MFGHCNRNAEQDTCVFYMIVPFLKYTSVFFFKWLLSPPSAVIKALSHTHVLPEIPFVLRSKSASVVIWAKNSAAGQCLMQ